MRLARSHFFRNVLVLMTGSVLAQGITLAFIPLLSRLYDPDTYGVFGVYLSIVGIVSCIATLRYDLALMLPKDDADAAGILWLCGIVVVGITVLAGVICFVFGDQLGTLLQSPELVPWLWSIPVSVFLVGIWQSLTSWSTRRKQFHRTSISRVVRAVVGPGSQVAAGLSGSHVLGLIFGAVLGDVCGSAAFVTQVFKNDWALIRGSLSRSRLKRLAREYSDFPIYTSPQSLLNTVSGSVPSLLLAFYFGVAVVGQYTIGVRIIQLPMSLITKSLCLVLYQRASEVYNAGGDSYALFKKTTLGLIGVAIIPTVLIFIFVPTIATIVLGEQWYTSGEYARWLVLWLAVVFCNSPSEIYCQIYRRQHVFLWWNVALLVCRVSAIVIGGLFFTALQTVILFSVVGFSLNVYLIAWVWLYLSRHPQRRETGGVPQPRQMNHA